MNLHSNIEILEQAVQYLGDLTSKVVFVGGCLSGLLIIFYKPGDKAFTVCTKSIIIPDIQDIGGVKCVYSNTTFSL